ncbi:MAG: YdcF family protein, partial [Acidobacteriota bacterium]
SKQKRSPRHSQPKPRKWLRRFLWLSGGMLFVVVALYAASTPILQWIGRELVRSDAIEPSDAIVELSGGEGDRDLEAADLYKSKTAPVIVLTTERDDAGLPELTRRGVRVERGIDQRRRYLKEMGVPDSAIIVLNDQAKSTVDEAAIVSAWIKSHPIRRVTIVTSAYHTRRAGHIFEWMLRGTGVVVQTRPATFDRFTPDSWWTDRNTLLWGLTEWQKTIYYRIRYW